MITYRKYFQSNNEGTEGGEGGQSTGTAAPENWDSYLASLPEAQRAQVEKFYSDKNQALLNSVKATRDERDNMARDLREAAKKAEKGSAAEKELLEKADVLEKTQRRAAFLEDAFNPEVQCRNPKAAFIVAEAEGLFTKKGDPDWAAIKKAAPELFGEKIANANAGRGTGQKPKPSTGMNSFIRKAAGRE